MAASPTDLTLALAQELRARKLELAVDEFVTGILHCMKEEGRNLEAAIASTRSYLDWQLSNDPKVTERDVAFNLEVFKRAAQEARETLQTAREIVAVDDNGRTDPVPLGEILALREAALAADAQES